ncbi:DUF6520 family protein [Flagellimonas amoyensis]|uniref:DUF6520 family protein n=1 Tax=Flagellimonas amoyensis TaxID=2169401 RepID=UPI000D3B7B29|nr:DUF6520 family protein [Allomuricauda amoyensis]
MKSNFLKLVLPAFAILLAVGIAFATEESNLMQPGYADTPSGPLPVQTDCLDEGQIQCKAGAYFVYKDIDLSDPLYEREE